VEGPDGVRGLAEATRELQHPERAVREASHSAIARAWEPHRATLACAMSALIAWRRATEGDVLARALSRFRLEARTLEALLGALHDREGLAARALAAVARSRGWDAVAPWDLAAPPPAIPAMALADGLTLIEQAFDAVDPRMGDTLRELASAGRIDADRGPRRRPGAFAAPFPLKRAARVFVSWSGTLADLRILGHELGHAFHYTLIRDGSPLEIDVPPSLVELPSSFAELAVAAELERASDPALVAAARAQDLLFAAAMIGIMPARFDLEREVTALGRSVTPEELDRMNGAASRRWLGEGGPIDPASWTRPHHYYGVGTRFAHITYTLGYLLALGLHSRRTPFEAITGFVRDLARRSVEDCARLHLGTDLGDRTFFASALDLVEARVGAAAA
jgi:oligoendopeptidase F